MVRPARLLAALLALAAAALLQGPARAAREVVAPHVTVVFEDPGLEPYAQRAAAAAESAWAALAARLGSPPPPLVLRLEDRTDRYNAFATVLPRPTVALRALFPLGGEVGFGAPDPLERLLVHELTHAWHFAHLDRPPGAPPAPRLGLVGEGAAAVPPAWLIEGLAVWAEGALTGGGRLDDARTRGLLRALAHEGDWPALADVARGGFEAWPGGEARYLLGGALVARLVDRHGLPALRAALREFNAGGPLDTFAAAWRRAVGTDLEAEWAAVREALAAEAAAAATAAGPSERLTEGGAAAAGPAVAPDGRRVAWLEGDALRVATLAPAGLQDARTVRAGIRVEGLDWLDDGRLLYARRVRAGGRDGLELHALDLATGREARWTAGARARFPRALPDGCALYVRDDVVAGAQLRRACPDGDAGAVWAAPEGVRIVGLDVSRGGRVALALWRRGEVDLALLEAGRPRWLTRDRTADLEPAWDGETALVYRTDRGGAAELWRLEPATGRAAPVARPLGGAFAPAPRDRELLFLELTGAGPVLARADGGGLEPARALPREAWPEAAPDPAAYPVRPYRPGSSLRPYGWLPAELDVALAPPRLAVALQALGEDAAGRWTWALTAGWDGRLSAGHLAGAHAALDLARDEGGILALAGPPRPLTAGLRVGAWPHAPHLAAREETALGAEGRLGARLDLDGAALLGGLRVGLVHLRSDGALHLEGRLDAAWTAQRADRFGHRRGPRVALVALTTAVPGGASAGAWLDASWLGTVPGLGAVAGLPLVAEAGLRAGWRPLPPVPLALADGAAVATLGGRLSLPVGWVYGDGRYALEQLTLEPRLRAWYDGALGVGADLAVWADATALYAGSLSLGLQGGWAQGPWLGVGARLPR